MNTAEKNEYVVPEVQVVEVVPYQVLMDSDLEDGGDSE